MAGNISTPGATVTSRVLALLGAFDERAPTAHADRARRARGAAGADGAPARRRAGRLGCARAAGRRASTSSGGGCGTSACSRRCRPGCAQLASPFLHDLYGATLATVHLAVRDGSEVLYLDRLAGNASVPGGQHRSAPGCRCTRPGSARCCSPTRPRRCRPRCSPTCAASRRTRSPSRGRCAASWRRVRREGYATTVEEMSLGACSVAVPDPRGRRRSSPRWASWCRACSNDRPRLRRGPAGRRAGHRAGAGGEPRGLSRASVRPPGTNAWPARWRSRRSWSSGARWGPPTRPGSRRAG